MTVIGHAPDATTQTLHGETNVTDARNLNPVAAVEAAAEVAVVSDKEAKEAHHAEVKKFRHITTK